MSSSCVEGEGSANRISYTFRSWDVGICGGGAVCSPGGVGVWEEFVVRYSRGTYLVHNKGGVSICGQYWRDKMKL